MMLICEQENHLREKQRRAEEKRKINLKEKVRKAQEEEAKVIYLTQFNIDVYFSDHKLQFEVSGFMFAVRINFCLKFLIKLFLISFTIYLKLQDIIGL